MTGIIWGTGIQGSSSQSYCALTTSQCRDHLVLLAHVVTPVPLESRVHLDLKVLVVVMVWMVTKDTQAHGDTLVHL